MDGALVIVRAVHFASTALIVGLLFFLTVVADPVLQRKALQNEAASAFRRRSLSIVSVLLALSLLSAMAWIGLQAGSMSGLPPIEAVSTDVLWVVLSKTQFGIVSDVRLIFAILLAISLVNAHRPIKPLVSTLLATALLVSLAWTGHAAGTVGATGVVHLASDVLHLCAAALWVGGLFPLLSLLKITRSNKDESWAEIAYQATRRFSTIGIVSVATLIVTGIINSWILVGTLRGLVYTDYGRLLLLKIALFAVMTFVAAVNRLRLTPRLSAPAGSTLQARALLEFDRNILIEIAIGLSVFAIVGMLGTLHPAIHLVPS